MNMFYRLLKILLSLLLLTDLAPVFAADSTTSAKELSDVKVADAEVAAIFNRTISSTFKPKASTAPSGVSPLPKPKFRSISAPTPKT